MSVAERVAEPLLVLTRQDISQLMDFNDYVLAVEDAFRLYEEGKALSPGVLDIHGEGGAFHVKAAGLPLDRTYVAVKVNGNFSENRSLHGLPTIQGAITLCDATNGSPLAFMDSMEVTTMRTGAATAVAAKYLARTDSKIATICGCGEQGKIQLIALEHFLMLEKVFAFDLDENKAKSFAEEMSKKLNLEVIPTSNLQEATLQSDAIVTCTTSRQAFLKSEDVKPGTFIAAVGADSDDKSELAPDLMASSKVVADIVDQCARIGDFHHALDAGALEKFEVYGELGEIVTRKKVSRTSPDDTIVFDSTGTALQDVAAAAIIYQRAKQKGLGYLCDLAG